MSYIVLCCMAGFLAALTIFAFFFFDIPKTIHELRLAKTIGKSSKNSRRRRRGQEETTGNIIENEVGDAIAHSGQTVYLTGTFAEDKEELPDTRATRILEGASTGAVFEESTSQTSEKRDTDYLSDSFDGVTDVLDESGDSDSEWNDKTDYLGSSDEVTNYLDDKGEETDFLGDEGIITDFLGDDDQLTDYLGGDFSSGETTFLGS